MKVAPYLNFAGNCKEAFQFYEKHLGGKITFMMPHSESPMADKTPEDWRDAILYAHMRIGETDLMGSDVPHQEPIRSAYLHLEVGDVAEVARVFAGLEKGGEVIMPVQETFWALSFGMVRDRFGVLWMIGASRPAPHS